MDGGAWGFHSPWSCLVELMAKQRAPRNSQMRCAKQLAIVMLARGATYKHTAEVVNVTVKTLQEWKKCKDWQQWWGEELDKLRAESSSRFVVLLPKVMEAYEKALASNDKYLQAAMDVTDRLDGKAMQRAETREDRKISIEIAVWGEQFVKPSRAEQIIEGQMKVLTEGESAGVEA